MPPWMVVFAGTAAGIVAAAALAIPEIAAVPRSEIGATLLPKLPGLAIAALGIYGLVVLFLSTTGLIARVLRVQRHFAGAGSGLAVARRDWVALLTASDLPRPSATMPAGPEGTGDGGPARPIIALDEARGEIARRHYIALARTHFFSILVVLGGLVGLGAAQDYGALPFRTGGIPTVSAILVLVGLLLLAALSRVALDVAAEPLLDGIAAPPAEATEIGLLRRIVALQEESRTGGTGAEGLSGLRDRVPEQLAAAIGEGYRPLLDAVAVMAENSRALEGAVRSSIETIATQQHRTDDRVPGPDALPELQAAVEELTAVLRRLSAAPDHSGEPAFTAGVIPSRLTAPTPGLARELRRLLQEIDAVR